MNRSDKILKELNSIQKRPGMYGEIDKDYGEFCAFMEGLLTGLTIDSDENGYLKGTAKYFDKLYGGTSAMPLSNLINITYPEMSDEEKCNAYLLAVIDYFQNQ